MTGVQTCALPIYLPYVKRVGLDLLNAPYETKTEALDAIRSGHAYAVAEGDHRVMLTLDEFSLACDCGQASAGIGERVALPSGAHAVVTVRLSARDGESHPVTVRLIRSGEIIGMTKAETPVQYQLADAQPVPDGGAYYRLEVVGQSGELLTNPIYAAAQAGERG